MGRGRAPCCDKTKVKRGPWTPAEDLKLITFINNHGHTNWRALPKLAGLLRCGKSCRLRWINYLNPDVRRGNFTPQEHLTIINLHNSFGNKWANIAPYLPGRTDNEIKNVWNTHLKKRLTNDTNRHQTEASPSCASSSITSAGGQKVENAPGQPKEKSQLLEGKEKTTSDDSPTSSHASNLSSMPNRALEFGFMNPALDDGKIEIPLDSGVDFWEVFGSLLDEDPTAKPDDITEISSINSPEKLEWIRFMEDELGLTSDKDGEIVPTNLMYEVMNSEPPAETGPGSDIFPIWPSSPHIY